MQGARVGKRGSLRMAEQPLHHLSGGGPAFHSRADQDGIRPPREFQRLAVQARQTRTIHRRSGQSVCLSRGMWFRVRRATSTLREACKGPRPRSSPDARNPAS